MPNPEFARQLDMFTGEWVDTRTPKQKKRDRERAQPRQLEMFPQREVAQFGVKARPLLPLSENTRLGLIFEDHRTEEEIEAARQQEAEERTYSLFEKPTHPNAPALVPDTVTLALVPYEASCLALTVIECLS